MSHVVIGKNGVLHRVNGGKDIEDEDVSETAVSCLYDSCVLASDLTLGDVLMLIKKNPEIQNIFQRYRAHELVEVAFSYPPGPGPSPERLEHDLAEFEYLVLEPVAGHYSAEKPIELRQSLLMSGVGYASREPATLRHREDYDVAEFPINQHMKLPIKLDLEVASYGECPKILFESISLFGVLGAIIYGYTWFGVCRDDNEDENKFFAAIKKAASDNVWGKPMTGEELYAETLARGLG